MTRQICLTSGALAHAENCQQTDVGNVNIFVTLKTIRVADFREGIPQPYYLTYLIHISYLMGAKRFDTLYVSTTTDILQNGPPLCVRGQWSMRPPVH